MMTSKIATLKNLFESNQGVHLTLYAEKKGSLKDFKIQLKSLITEADEWLKPVMAEDERSQFLDPLNNLINDSSLLSQIKDNIGLFRNADVFRIINIPVNVDDVCLVATSFHIKPLLRWLQMDQDFLLVCLNEDDANFYQGGHDSLKLIDTIDFEKNMIIEDEVVAWLNDLVPDYTKKSKLKLFIAGEKNLSQRIRQKMRYKNVIKNRLSENYNQSDLPFICSRIRHFLKKDSQNNIEKTLLEFRLAEENRKVCKNIFQIAKSVVDGKVRKLIVTDELNIFGKIDRKSGFLEIHPFDLDHEDDDILDDLAQIVLSQGGQVTVAPLDHMPNGKPVLAILDDENNILQKSDFFNQREILNERFG